MALEPLDFLTLVGIEDKTKYAERHYIDMRLPPAITVRAFDAKFHFPIEEAHVVRHFTRYGEPIQYDIDGVRFQWIARGLSSKIVQDPKHPKDPSRKVLVGVIDAIIVHMPEDVAFTVTLGAA